MLPIPNLDDRYFDQILDQALSKIHTIQQDWTDENEHDPGITLLQLFAWLTEAQQYSLNRVRPVHEWLLLKLVGINKKPYHSAEVILTFDLKPNHKQTMHLTAGTQLWADEIPFELTEELFVFKHQMISVMVQSGKQFVEVNKLNQVGDTSFRLFGEQAQFEDAFWIGFDQPFQVGETIHLWVDLLNGAENVQERIPSATICWEIFSENGWTALECMRDETNHLSGSGLIQLRVLEEMQLYMLQDTSAIKAYWLRCKLVAGMFEQIPFARVIRLNAARAVQKNTRIIALPGQTKEITDDRLKISSSQAYPQLEMKQIQLKHSNGLWIDLEHSWIEQDRETSQRVFYVNMPNGWMDTLQYPIEARVILAESHRIHSLAFAQGTGLPNQSIILPNPLANWSDLTLSIAEQYRWQQWAWRDWQAVEWLELTDAADYGFVLDRVNQEIGFGNQEQGRAPASAPFSNIRLLHAAECSGEKGNVNAFSINQFARVLRTFDESMLVSNIRPARHGRSEETLIQAKIRLQEQIRAVQAAITSEDIERIVLDISGLDVARVHALPLYRPGMRDYPQQTVSGQLTVVVMPHSNHECPQPSEGFLQTIRRELRQRRMIGMEMHVIGPSYIEISVHATIIVDSEFTVSSESIEAAIRNWLKPYHPQYRHDHEVWPFGAMVSQGDLLTKLNEMVGVQFVSDLWMDGNGIGFMKRANGDILIPAHALACSGAHHIQIIHSRNQ